MEDGGIIDIELNEEVAPSPVRISKLVKVYNGLTFHRAIPGLRPGGRSAGQRTWRPGWNIKGEFG